MTYSIKVNLISDLPTGWTHRRLKEVADVIPSNVDKLRVEGQSAVRLCNYVDTYKNERITTSIDFMSATATQAQIERLGLRKGDITITKDSESPWDIAVPAYIAEDIDGLVCGYHLSKITPAAGVMHGGYLTWALRSKPINVQFALSAQGITRYGLSSSGLADGVVPCPPIDEQHAIASYLDAETKRIDGLIGEKQKLIAALDEMKQVVTTEAICTGVGPSVPHVPGDRLWFPSVPRTWRVQRLKFLVSGIEQGWSPQAESRQADDGEWGVLKAGACNGGDFRPDEQKALPPGIVPDIGLEVRQGDVLMSRGSGSADLVGSVALVGPVRRFLMLSDLLYRLSVDDPEEINPRWLVLALGSSPLRRQIRLSLRGAEGLTRKVTTADIKELVLPVPPRAEQDAIVGHILAEWERLAELRAHATKEVELLLELRAATITDAVLGRIDVRPN